MKIVGSATAKDTGHTSPAKSLARLARLARAKGAVMPLQRSQPRQQRERMDAVQHMISRVFHKRQISGSGSVNMKVVTFNF